MPFKKAVIHTDGGAEPNPGQAAIAAVIRDEKGNLLASICESIGFATNNQAEYRAIIAALEKTISLGVTEASLFSDSELVVRQLKGQYRVKAEDLKPLYLKVMQLKAKLAKFAITHIPREKNSEADALASRGIRRRN